MNVQLSPSQKKTEEEFRDFLLNPDESELVISGFAGSGKTFLVKYLKQVAEDQKKLACVILGDEEGWDTYFTATTNKAATVLQNNIFEPTYTIHGLLGLTVRNNTKTGKTVLTKTRKTRPLGRSLVFIDEASMVSKELLEIIREYSTPGKTKLVFIGDKYQLAPVDEGHSIVFHNPKNMIELTEIQRQVAGSAIIQTSQNYRKVLDHPEQTLRNQGWPALSTQGKEIYVVDRAMFKKAIDTAYSSSYFMDDYKILAWKNDTVIRYNNYIRKLQGRKGKVLEKGERVVTNNPIKNKNDIMYTTDSYVHIVNIYPSSEDGLPGWTVELSKGIKRFMPQDWWKAKQRMNHYYRHKDFDGYFHIKDNFLDLRPPHASTVHKSQGSTYKTVFIDVDDIRGNVKWDEVARLMYVGISRASESVYLCGSL